MTLPLLVMLGCALQSLSPQAAAQSRKSSSCHAAPRGARIAFRHTRSRMLAKLGSPRHRGADVIALDGDENQTLGGKLAYTKVDKDLEDEDVHLFACTVSRTGGTWRSLGVARTNGDGRFTLALAGSNRLPVGTTDLYAHVPGDGSGTWFLGYVARRDEQVIVSDIDGTITSSENAVYLALFGKDIAHQPDAPEVYAQSGKTIVYVTARGDQLTDVTRAWLAAHGFPRGPLRLASSMVTLPGRRTVALKTRTLAQLRVPIAAGIGNRASDITAYRNIGLAAERIFINLPEFTTELSVKLAAGEATAFDDYADLRVALRR
ncbi:MAG TPA: hypothetical protein VK427_21860 [Kofleriaceae bacterium]|nr:hypothetical protein [Kofleriaceae bacterium]